MNSISFVCFFKLVTLRFQTSENIEFFYAATSQHVTLIRVCNPLDSLCRKRGFATPVKIVFKCIVLVLDSLVFCIACST